MHSFIINDENKINSYGFRVLNAGIDLERFKSNPVMLDDHWNSTRNVLGGWKNVRVEASQLLADADFDMEDAQAKLVSGKVSRGYIKGCSMGIMFDPNHMNVEGVDSYVLTECELMEVSIVAVPSNANAVHLFARDGHLMEKSEVQLSIQNRLKSPEINNIQNSDKMDKYNLSAKALTALNLNSAEDANAVSAAIEKLHTDLQNETTARKALQAQLEAAAKANAEKLVADAISEGRITADAKDEFVNMAVSNYAMAEKVLSAIPAKKTLRDKVDNPAGDSGEIKTEEDFLKLTIQQQLAWKAANPEAYKKLFA